MATDLILVQQEPKGPSMLIELAINAGQTNVTFKDVAELRNSDKKRVIIKGLRLVVPGLVAGPATLALPIIALTDLQKIYLNIYCEGWIKSQLMPILELNDTFIEGSGIPWHPNGTKFNNWENLDWDKTNIQFAQGTSCSVACALVLEADYVNIDNLGNEIIGPSK